MFEFSKLCKECENLTVAERGVLMVESSVRAFAKLKLLDISGIDPVETLAGFIIGSVVADGRLDEKEYALIYPALVHVFGDDFDFESIKGALEKSEPTKKIIRAYTADLMSVLSLVDDSLAEDIVMLCLCVVTIDGKVSLRERNYIRQLCKV